MKILNYFLPEPILKDTRFLLCKKFVKDLEMVNELGLEG